MELASGDSRLFTQQPALRTAEPGKIILCPPRRYSTDLDNVLSATPGAGPAAGRRMEALSDLLERPSPTSRDLLVSDAEPGSFHDITTARLHALPYVAQSS